MAGSDFIIGEGLERHVPGFELVFEPEWHTSNPRLSEELRRGEGHWDYVRPVEAGAVLWAIEEIYLASILNDLPPEDYRERPEWAAEADPRSLTLRLHSLRMGSPLHVIVDIPSAIYVPTFAAFCYGLAHVFGVPYRAATAFESARQSYFAQRVATARAKDEWLDYKAERVEQQTRLRLKAVDVVVPMHNTDEQERPMEPPAEK